MNALQFAAHFNRTWSLRFLLKTPGYTDLVEAPPIPPNMLPAQFAIESDNPIMLDELVKLRPHDPLYSSLLYSPEDGNIDLAGFALVMNREWKTFKHIIEKYVLDVTNIHAGGIDKPRFFSPTFGVNPGPASAIHSPIIVDVAKPDVGSSSHQALIDQLARECLFRNYTLLEIAAACVLHDLPGVYSPHTQSWLQGSMIKWLVSVAGAGTFNGPQHQARKIFTESR